MQPRLQRRVQRYGWDKAAEHYEAFWRDQLRPSQVRLLEMAAAAPGERVLDIACGTGLATFPVAETVGSNGHVLATDLSQKMVDAVAAGAAERGLDHVSTERADAESLGVADGTFDLALDALGLMYVPDPLAALREMHRALRPGGRAVCSVWGARNQCGWAEIFPIVDRRVESEVCPMFFQLGTQDVLEAEFRSAGFEDVESDRLSVTLRYDSAATAIGAAFAGGPVALAYSRFDDTTRNEAHAEYLESIEAYRHGEAFEIPGEFVVTRGRR
ncbi:MAG: class I SAM-dependent methyltransferase [Planctomycetota bacterium]